jgi:NADP-dependent 3-hydroxy acid dehydrogenase YdfG
MTGISGKVVAVTGASSGIGEATARLLAERGAAVVLGARRTERLDQIAQQIRDQGGRAISHAVDVTRGVDLRRLVDGAVAAYGRLDVLVSNAGISKIGPMADLDVEGWEAMIDVNLRGVLYGIAAALPVFRRQGHGHLVTTVSTELADSIDNPEVREQIRRSRDEFAISPDAVARAIAFAIEQPYDVEIGDITIRPAVQG